MEEKESIDFNEKFSSFIDKLNKKEESRVMNKPYVDEEEIKEREEIQQNQNKKTETSFAVHNFFESQIFDLKEKLSHTKFKNRVLYELNDEQQKIKFLLDNKTIFQLRYDDFLLNYNSGDLEDKVIQDLYVMENAYTLIDFVNSNFYVSKDILFNKFRIKYDEFVKMYVIFTEKKYGADKLVNIKKIGRILKKCFDCDRIKYQNEWQLSKITTLEIYQEKINNTKSYSSNQKKIFKQFIEKYCEIHYSIDAYKRIKRSDFRKVYNLYLKQNNLLEFKMNNYEMRDLLLKEYNENFIKSNGIWYMKKIKFKNFSE